MPPVSARPASTAETRTAHRGAKSAERPFFGLIDAVLVDETGEFPFDGAIAYDQANAVWTWMRRDLAPDLIASDISGVDPGALSALDLLLPELLARATKMVTAAGTSQEAQRRLVTQIGGENGWNKLPQVLTALRCRGLLEKAQGFGRATNGMSDEAALAMALQSMPLQDQAIAALLMMATVGQVSNPSRLITAVIRIAGSAAEASITRAGFGPLIDAMLAHAQSQLSVLAPVGTFADIDLICRAIDRFNRLIRPINSYVEMGRFSRWSATISALTKAASERVEPKLREVGPDVNKALRRSQGTDRLDSDQILMALNGIYLLATVRDCRDSLAVNALFDQVWNQVGQALEIHLQRNLDALRQSPSDKITSARLDAAIKMAELRFNAEYAEVLRRARDAVERRTGS